MDIKLSEEKLREYILIILNAYKTDMDSYYLTSFGVPEDNFDDVADEIIKVIRGEK